MLVVFAAVLVDGGGGFIIDETVDDLKNINMMMLIHSITTVFLVAPVSNLH